MVIFVGILSASLLGSWHCAGMCGPFASFLGRHENELASSIYQQIFYHFGRLLTYVSLTALAFTLSMPVRSMIGPDLIYGILIFWLLAAIFEKKILNWKMPEFLVRLNREHRKIGNPVTGLLLGVSTTLLPCVWLYGFIGMAVTQNDYSQALMVILVFWLGTLPALILSQTLFLKVNYRIRQYSRRLSLVLMLAISVLTLYFHRPLSSMEGGASCIFHQHH